MTNLQHIGQTAIHALQSSKTTLRLEQIASLRARGIGDHVALPQLVVCGDQSAGKSSVLEGVTGLPFPRQDGLCTKFPTEIILQHTNSEQTIVASILPHLSRSSSSKEELRQYRRQFESFDELPLVIEEAGFLMGIRGFRDLTQGPAFGEDVLRIEVCGPSGLHLTVVDLPGLISVANEEQTEEDVRTVHNLVDSYAENPRTIILAVVQAGNDIANQPIIQKSKRFDKEGQRTIGIITKPDLINIGTEKRIALLAKNQDTTKLKLGFFLIKNPTPTEIAEGITSEQRQRNEAAYFCSSPWKEQDLSRDRVGILSLRTYLQSLLDQHIERELPKVREEIRSLIAKTEQKMLDLGEERPTVGQIRLFLSRVATRFSNLVTSALNGTYHEADAVFFGGHNDEHSTRLRAVVHQHNTEFADYMRDNGERRRIIRRSENDDSSEEEPEEGQILVTELEMRKWVKQIYSNTRGKELPGNYNHVLLSELFHIQSSRWREIADDHVAAMFDEIRSFVRAALEHVARDEQVLLKLVEITTASLQSHKEIADKELENLWQDEQRQPITYNHYYTDNVQNARHKSLRDLLKRAMTETTAQDWNGKLHVSNNALDAEKLLASLQRRIVVDMDGQACTEALAGLSAYYRVALKTFVDNVCRQVIERHLLSKLPTIFSPEIVASFDDETLRRIAAESEDSNEKRRQLREFHEALGHSLRDLRRQ
ncbi:interferon-induced GTP-binding protein Mx2 [Xylogone sp. PMI_703]|nr:interferon-induced GTP-binding protein Mx2 [Xylogone sp. PMI_703]